MNHDQDIETLSHAPDEDADAPVKPAAELSADAGAADDADSPPQAGTPSTSPAASADVAEAEADVTPEEEPVAEVEEEPEAEPEPEPEPGPGAAAEPSADDFRDPHAAVAESEDPEAAARAALGLDERPEDTDLRPEEAAAILSTPEPEPIEEEVVLVEPDLADAELLVEYEEEARPPEASPYDRPGAWYVVHTYSGYEKKVKSNLESRVKSLHMEGRIHEVVIPMDDVIEFKGGKKTVVQKKVFPGYLLVRMDLDDETWGAVRNTPGVTGFVGSGAKPTPLSRKEVESILRVRPEDEAKKARPRLEFEVGDQVRVTAGPFADFNGLIDEINVDQSTLKVLVNIFGRETPVTLDFADVAKL